MVDSFHRMDEMMRQPQHAVELGKYRDSPGIYGTPVEAMPASSEAVFSKVQAAMTKAQSESAPLHEHLESQSPARNAGCTAVVAVVHGDQLIVANAGDSRAVLCRGSTAVALSNDHKPRDPVEARRIKLAGGWVNAEVEPCLVISWWKCATYSPTALPGHA